LNTYHGYSGAMASFFQTGDPNAHKLTNASETGVPDVINDAEFVIDINGFKDVTLNQLSKRCNFWMNVGSSVPV
jgi:hypothetical protein